MRTRCTSSLAVVGLVWASAAEAQLRVVVSDGEVTPLGTVGLMQKPSIDDNAVVAFMATLDGLDAALVSRDGMLKTLAKAGDPAPCGGGTIAGIGDGLGGVESVAIRGLWTAFDIYDSTGRQRRIGSDGGALRCMASSGDSTSAGALARFDKHPLTNEAGEVLVDDSRLWLVPNAANSYALVAGAGATVPAPPMHTPGPARYWLLDDDGDVTVAIETTYLGGQRLHALHGRPGAMTLIEPLGIDEMDTFTLSGTNGPMIGVNRAGSVVYEAYIEPPAPELPYYGIWAGAPGATTEALKFPLDAGGVTLARLYARPHVIASSHFVAEMEVSTTGGPRQALVRWSAGSATVIATTGAPLPGHPEMMVERFGAVGVDESGTIYVSVVNGSTSSGIYRVPTSGTIEKVLATGDTLAIAGVDETIRGVRFETTRGTGYGTTVSASGGIVFVATYQNGTRSALVTSGGQELAPPDLVLELQASQTRKNKDTGEEWEFMQLKITNVGTGPSLSTLLELSPDRGFCTELVTTDPDFAPCFNDRLEPGDSVLQWIAWEAVADYPYVVEVSSAGQIDADPSNNKLTGTIINTITDVNACYCSGSDGAPYETAPLLLTFLFVLRRRGAPAR